MALVQQTNKPSRFKGPVSILLRGAGSGGNDPLKIGDGGDVGLSIDIPTGQTALAMKVSQPQAGAILFQIDQFGNIVTGGATNAVQFALQLTLTAAQLIAMYAAPVAIILAKAVGVGIVIDQIVFQMKATATAFTGGGIVTFQYGVSVHGGGTLVHAGSIPAAVITAGSAGSTLTLLSPTAAASGLTVPTDGTTASGLYISNATAPFAAGTGTGIVTVFGEYITQS
jgi:hypothetical protein